MSTVDLTKVAGFKAVDAEGNDMGVVSLSEMTNMVKESIIQEAVAMQSVSTLAEASTLAATDTYEDQLPTSDTFSYVRTLDSSGNPKRTSSNAFASVVGGLIGTATPSKNGLISSELYSYVSSYAPETQSGKFTHLFKIGLYQHVCFYLKFGSVTSTYLSNCSIIDLQNRSASSLSVVVGKTTIFSSGLEANLYARKNSDGSIDVFVKQVTADYPTIKLSLIFCSGIWSYVGTVSDVSESELTKIL